jgi:hypothetical protein
MTTFVQSLKESQAAAEAFSLMDMLSLRHDVYAETGPVALTLNTIVAIPDIYANSALLRQDPAHAYGSAADNFSSQYDGKLDFVI